MSARATVLSCHFVAAMMLAPWVGPVGAAAPSADTTPALRDVATVAAPKGFAVESYYRIRWGFEEEFTTLYRRNHLPFLQRQLERGILLEVRLDKPHEHLPEDHRWDLRVTVVYPDAAAAYLAEKNTEADYQSIVKTDAAEKIFKLEEQRRFELLQAHWDVNVNRGESFVPK